MGQRLVRFKAHLWVLASIKEEGSLLGGGVHMVVIGELCKWKQWKPVVLPFSDKDPQVLL